MELVAPGVKNFAMAGIRHTSGTSLDTIRLAKPSRMAVLPTPGGPMSCGDQRFDACPWFGRCSWDQHSPLDLTLFALKELCHR